MHPRTTAAAAAIIATALVSACSSGGGLTFPAAGQATSPGSQATTPGGQATGSATPTPAATAATPTGNQIGQWLASLPLPKGWARPGGAGNGETTSGSMITPPYGPNHRETICSAIGFGDQASQEIDWWSMSNATLQIDYPSDTDLPDVELSVGVFKPGYAARTIGYYAGIVRRCRSFRDHYLHNDASHASMTTVPHLGDQNIFVTSSVHTGNVGTMTGRVLLVRVGNDLVACDDGTSNNVRAATVQGFAAWLAGLWLKSKYA